MFTDVWLLDGSVDADGYWILDFSRDSIVLSLSLFVIRLDFFGATRSN